MNHNAMSIVAPINGTEPCLVHSHTRNINYRVLNLCLWMMEVGLLINRNNEYAVQTWTYMNVGCMNNLKTPADLIAKSYILSSVGCYSIDVPLPRGWWFKNRSYSVREERGFTQNSGSNDLTHMPKVWRYQPRDVEMYLTTDSFGHLFVSIIHVKNGHWVFVCGTIFMDIFQVNEYIEADVHEWPQKQKHISSLGISA